MKVFTSVEKKVGFSVIDSWVYKRWIERILYPTDAYINVNLNKQIKEKTKRNTKERKLKPGS